MQAVERAESWSFLMGVARASELLLRQTPVFWGLVFGRGWGVDSAARKQHVVFFLGCLLI